MVAQQAQKAPDVYRLQRKLASTRRSLTLSGVPGAVADDDTVAHITLGPSAAHCAQLLQLAERRKSRDAVNAAAAQAGAAADGDAMAVDHAHADEESEIDTSAAELARTMLQAHWCACSIVSASSAAEVWISDASSACAWSTAMASPSAAPPACAVATQQAQLKQQCHCCHRAQSIPASILTGVLTPDSRPQRNSSQSGSPTASLIRNCALRPAVWSEHASQY